jgi:Sulfotransferase family
VRQLAATQQSAAGGRKSMMRRKPNLFLIGAMKAGTSYLRKLLNAHPDIYMCEPDEPSYFVDPRQLRTLYPEMWERGLWRSEERYLDLFRPAGDAPILGEASTAYAKLPLVPGVPERIAAFNREARFIYLLRDPVERAISHYWHMARHHAEHRPIAEAARRDSQFVAFSHYAMQLRPFLERFGRERVTVVVHEQLVADPTGVMGGVYQWLGVDAAAADLSGFSRPENVTPDAVSVPGWGGVPRRLRQAPALKSAVVRLPPAVHRTLHRLTTREVLRRAVDVTAAVAFLLPEQRRQTDELAGLLGCSFPEWTTLYGASSPATLTPPPADATRPLEP